MDHWDWAVPGEQVSTIGLAGSAKVEHTRRDVMLGTFGMERSAE